MEQRLERTIVARLGESPDTTERLRAILLAAFEGTQAVDELLDEGVAPEARTNGAKAAAPVGAYISAVTRKFAARTA